MVEKTLNPLATITIKHFKDKPLRFVEFNLKGFD